MLRYFMLVMACFIAMNAGAQTTYNYWGYTLTESDNILLLKMEKSATAADFDSVLNKINNDPDFTTYSTGAAGYWVLYKDSSSSISKAAAIARYKSEPYISYASFVYPKGDNFCGVSNEIFVQTKTGVTTSQMVTAANAYNLTSYEVFDSSLNIYLLYFPKDSNTLDIAQSMYDSSLFAYVEPNFFMSVDLDGYGNHTTTDGDCETAHLNTLDSAFYLRKQWGIYNDSGSSHNYVSQAYVGQYGGTHWNDINVCHAWDFTNGSCNIHGVTENATGSGVVVAVIDDGVDVYHPDLANNILTDNSGNVIGFDAPNSMGYPLTEPLIYPGVPGSPDAYSEHGTACAGIIAAVRNNAHGTATGNPMFYGMTGVAYNAKIMPIRIFWTATGLNQKKAQTDCYLSANGILRAAHMGADILSCSWSFYPVALAPPGTSTLEAAINTALTTGRSGKGCVIVFSTGNLNTDSLNWPSSNSKVIAVGAMTMCEERKQAGSTGLNADVIAGTVSCDGVNRWGSNYGYGLKFQQSPWSNFIDYHGRLSVVAPGVHIYTTRSTLFSSLGGFYLDFDGTSAACPHVAGVAALMLQFNPCLKYEEVKNIIELSANRIGSYSYTNPGNVDINGTWNTEMGHGRVNAGDAVTLAHDIYKQNDNLSGKTAIYTSQHMIFAGKDVTNILPQGYYTISGGSNVAFNASEAIYLDPGFEASDALFDAQIGYTCTTSHSHYKPSNNNSIDRHYTRKFIKDQNKIGDFEKVNIYPNPSSDKINIEYYTDSKVEVNFTVFNTLGQQVLSVNGIVSNNGDNIQVLPVQNLPDGIYYLVMQTLKMDKQFKFVKE